MAVPNFIYSSVFYLSPVASNFSTPLFSVRVFTGSDLITGSDRIGPEIDYLAHF